MAHLSSTIFSQKVIVESILSYLDARLDLQRCRLVSKVWHEVEKELKSKYISFAAIPLLEAGAGPTGVTTVDQKVLTSAAENGIAIEFKNMFSTGGYWTYQVAVDINGESKSFHTFYNMRRTYSSFGTPEAVSSFIPVHTETHIFSTLLYTACIKFPELFRHTLVKMKNAKNLDYTHIYFVEANTNKLDMFLGEERLKPLTYTLLAALTEFHTDLILDNSISHEKGHIPKKTITTQKQPYGLAPSCTLYKYQLDAVNWMKSIEVDISEGVGFEFVDLVPFPKPSQNRISRTETPEIVTPEKVKDHVQMAFPKGGILADEMGLGKTNEIIALILARQGNSPVFTEKGTKLERYLVEVDGAKYFGTNATLVICPAILIKQWSEEIEKNTRPHLSVVILGNSRDIKSCTYQDIFEADVVLFAHHLLHDVHYFNINTPDSSIPKDAARVKQRQSYRRTQFMAFAEYSNKMKEPILDYFYWQRIVVDEAHEIIGSPIYTQSLYGIKAKSRWYVTGTPFPNSAAVANIGRFLHFPDLVSDGIRALAFSKVYIQHLFWRNTKETIKNEYELPPLIEDLVLLEFTPIETFIYKDCVNNYDLDEQSKVCDSPHISPVYSSVFRDSTLNSMHTKLIEHVKAKLHSYPGKIEVLNRDNRKQDKIENKQNEKLPVRHKKLAEKQKEVDEMTLDMPYRERQLLRKELRLCNSKVEKSNTKIKIAKENRHKNNTEIAGLQKQILADTELLADLEKLNPCMYDGPDMVSHATIEIEKPVPEDGEAVKLPENGDTSVDEEVLLPWSKIVEFKVDQLKEELEKRAIQIPKKHRKKDLQKLLRGAVKNNVKKDDTTDDAEPKTLKRKNSNLSTPPKKLSRKSSKIELDREARTQKLQDKIDEQNLLSWWAEKEGTKMGNLLFYLKKMWADNPAAKVIIFSQFGKFLERISEKLTEKNIEHALADGNNIRRGKKLAAFKDKEADIRVLLLNLQDNASGLNIIEASHIILMEPMQGVDGKSKEQQAIGRAYRQGQVNRVTVVRFIVRDTIEHKAYTRNYGETHTNTADPLVPLDF